MKKTLNLNVNKDDQNINDFLSCWAEFDERPNKVSIFTSFDSKSFIELIGAENLKESTIQSEIYPSYDESLENIKYLSKIDKDIFISYVIFDKRTEESFVGEVSIYFTSKSKERVDLLISQLESSIKLEEYDSEEHKFYTLTLENSGFDILPINYLNADYENLDLYFNDQVLKSTKKLAKKINENSKGISIFYGEKGSGKSTLVSYLSQVLGKKVIFIPSTMTETSINSIDFRNFLLKHKNSVILLDDCEIFSTDFYLKTNNIVKNLIQLVDGIDSDNFNLQIILIFNVESFEEIDENFIESNNLQEIIHLDCLDSEKVKELVKHLSIRRKIKKEVKLVDILQKKNKYEKTKSIGFE